MFAFIPILPIQMTNIQAVIADKYANREVRPDEASIRKSEDNPITNLTDLLLAKAIPNKAAALKTNPNAFPEERLPIDSPQIEHLSSLHDPKKRSGITNAITAIERDRKAEPAITEERR